MSERRRWEYRVEDLSGYAEDAVAEALGEFGEDGWEMISADWWNGELCGVVLKREVTDE